MNQKKIKQLRKKVKPLQVQWLKSLLPKEQADTITIDNVDDEGLLKDNRYFSWSGRNIAGKALIIGHDDAGETIATTYDLQEVVDRVEWLPEGHRETPYMEFKAWQ